LRGTVAPATPYTPNVSPSPDVEPRKSRPDADWRLLLLGVLILSALYVAWHLGRGWVAHDEGTLGQSAERLLQGQLPHRDFDEIYTGGLTYLNAAAFRVLGVNLFNLRIVLFAVFLAWVPAVFYVASRLVKPIAAAGVTLLCVAWSLPNYTAPLPSWYNLFLTVFGVAALFRWLEDRRTRWIVVAGAAAGLSFLVKVIGLYFVAGVLLFAVYQAHEQSRGSAGAAARRAPAYSAFATLSLLGFVAALFMVVRHGLYAAEVIQFVLPGALVAGFLVRNEWVNAAGDSRARFTALAGLLVPFLFGFALPVAVFLVPFVRGHALEPLFNGVFLLSSKRFGSAAYRMISPWSMLGLVPFVLLALYGRRMAARFTRYHALALAALFGAWLVTSASVPLVYRLVWYAFRALPPVLTLTGVLVLARPAAGDDSPLRRSQALLLLGVMAVFTLVQFPFSAPLLLLRRAARGALGGGAVPLRDADGSAVPALTTVFLIAFAVLRVNTSLLFGMGVLYQPYPPTLPLEMPRGGLSVPDYDANMYNAAVMVLHRYARGGYTWASPDCPEIYFLSGLQNPTRTLFDFFDDPTGRDARILGALEQHGVTAVVLNRAPQFSPNLTDAFVAEIERRYPFGADVGKFQIRWQR
jgi:4-amino-4-deoxy-L-arabinose transferase and related glycosyltransferases of PMT family